MSDNPRMPGHPSDIPSSRSSEGSSNTHIPGPPGPPPYIPPPGPSGNNQTRNIIIGAIATMLASTTVYYLTQYVNNKKTDSIPNYLVMKDATTNAWSRYVTMDNIYYKAVKMLSTDQTMQNDPYKYVNEVNKEADIFKKDANKIAKEKNVDPALKTMLSRRTDRQTEYGEILNAFMSNAKVIMATTPGDDAQKKKIIEASAPVLSSVNLLYKKAANEIEGLCKTLSATYAVPFNPNEVMIYADYKKGVGNLDTSTVQAPDPDEFSTQINPKDLIGNWADKGNKISFKKDGSMNSTTAYGDEATGTWKIENDRLRIESVNTLTKTKYILIFGLKNITATSFTMQLTTTPFYIYNAVRQNDN